MGSPAVAAPAAPVVCAAAGAGAAFCPAIGSRVRGGVVAARRMPEVARWARQWRRQRQLEHVSGAEVAAWLHAVWLVADLIDMSQGTGTVADATFGAIVELAEKANEGNRRCGFCDIHQDQANVLIAGAGVYICDRCLGTQLARPLPDHLQGDDRRCLFCGHADRSMALGANARICEVCLRVGREMMRERRRGPAASLDRSVNA